VVLPVHTGAVGVLTQLDVSCHVPHQGLEERMFQDIEIRRDPLSDDCPVLLSHCHHGAVAIKVVLEPSPQQHNYDRLDLCPWQ
jgi:hypothetical protein